MDKQKFIGAVIKSIEDKAERILWAKVSDGVLDRDSEIIRLSAWADEQLAKFIKTSGALLLCHRYETLPIGKILELEKRRDGLYMRAQLIKHTEAADEAWAVISQLGKIGFSVGFLPKRSTEFFVSALEDREKASALRAGLGPKDRVRVYTSVELLEVSLTSVPSLSTATLIAFKSGKLKSVQLKEACGGVLNSKYSPQRVIGAINNLVKDPGFTEKLKKRSDEVVAAELQRMRSKLTEHDKKPAEEKTHKPEVSLQPAAKGPDIIKQAQIQILVRRGLLIPEGEEDKYIAKYWPSAKQKSQDDQVNSRIKELTTLLLKTMRR